MNVYFVNNKIKHSLHLSKVEIHKMNFKMYLVSIVCMERGKLISMKLKLIIQYQICQTPFLKFLNLNKIQLNVPKIYLLLEIVYSRLVKNQMKVCMVLKWNH